MWLTCANEEEAAKIANTLLTEHLITCAKQIPISADYRWQGKIEHASEVLLIMESREDLFDEVEGEVAKLHSFKTFVLEAIPITKISKKADQWLRSELKNG